DFIQQLNDFLMIVDNHNVFVHLHTSGQIVCSISYCKMLSNRVSVAKLPNVVIKAQLDTNCGLASNWMAYMTVVAAAGMAAETMITFCSKGSSGIKRQIKYASNG